MSMGMVKKRIIFAALVVACFALAVGLSFTLTPSSQVEAYTVENNATYALYPQDSTGALIAGTTYIYGGNYGTGKPEAYGRTLYVPVAGTNKYQADTEGFAGIRVLSAPLYSGDEIIIQYTKIQGATASPTVSKYTFAMYNSNGTLYKAQDIPFNTYKTPFTIPSGFTGKAALVIRDGSTQHTGANPEFGGNFLYACEFQIAARSSTIGGGVTLDTAMSNVASRAYTYNGSTQSPFGSYTSYFTLSGSYSGKEPGTYTAYVTPKPAYQWSDGTHGQKTCKWTISKGEQSFSIDAVDITYGGTAELAVSGVKDGAAITYSVLNGTGSATVSGSKLTATGAGTVIVAATAAATTRYNTSAVTQVVEIKKNPQPPAAAFANAGAVKGGETLKLNVTGTAENPTVTFSVPANNGVATVSGNTLTPTGAGKVTVTATIGATANYAAMTLTQEITVTKAEQTFTLSAPPDLRVLGGTGKIQINGAYSASAFTYSSSNDSVVKAGADGTLTAGDRVGTATVTVTNPGNGLFAARTQTVTVTTYLDNGFYTGSISGNADNTVYATLSDAIDKANGQTIYIKGSPTVGETVVIDQAVDLRGNDASATLTRSGGSFSVFDIKSGGSLKLSSLKIDGENVSGDSLIAVNGGSLTLNGGAALVNGKATNGGAVYVGAGGSLTVTDDAELMNNSASYGGAVYVADGAGNVALSGGKINNNGASAVGDGVYIAGSSVVSMDGRTSATGGISNSIGIGGDGRINITGGIDRKISVVFEDPAAQAGGAHSYVTSSVAGVTRANLKEYFRVVNNGYTFSPDTAGADGLTLVESNSIVAVLWDGGKYVEYYSAQAAIDAAAAASKASGVNADVFFVHHTNAGTSLDDNEVEIMSTVTVPKDAKLTFKSIERRGSGNTFDYVAESDPVVLKRQDVLTAEMVRVEAGGTLVLNNIVIDGGAVWASGKPVVTDVGGGAGTAVTGNDASQGGVTAHAPAIVNGGDLTMNAGSTVRNNDNNYAKPGEGFGSQNYGGGVRNEGAGAFTLAGGTIENCYSREGGAVMNVNKPTAPGAVAGGNPTVKIVSGAIKNNASQMKGAAVQTIYGGANTTVSGGVISGNVSLHDLGALSVEEGGTLTVSGGQVAAGTDNGNAIYVYNKYGQDDYDAAPDNAKPYIEGAGAAQLYVTAAPEITGKIHTDDACALANKGTPYTPTFDISGYTGGVISVSLESDRGYGQIAQSTSDNFAKLDVPTFKADASYDISERYEYKPLKNGKYELSYGGFDINIEQSEPGRITVTGKGDPNAEELALDVGGTKTVLTVGADGVIAPKTLDVVGTSQSVSVSVTYEDLSKDIGYPSAARVSVLQLDKETGILTAPDGAKYVNNAGGEAALPTESGLLPNDIKIENGKATFIIDGEQRVVAVGDREAAPDGVLGGKTDGRNVNATDSSLAIGGAAGYEYNLIDKSGKLVGEWTAAAGGTVVFGNLSAAEYTVVARKAADSAAGTLPSPYATINGAVYSPLTSADVAAKNGFAAAYGKIENSLYDPPAEPAASAAEIKTVLDNYDALSASVKSLTSVSEMGDRLNESYAHALANEWTYDASDRGSVNSAFDSYEKLTDGAKALAADRYEKLIDAKKNLAQETLSSAANQCVKDGANSAELGAISSGYVDKIFGMSAGDPTDFRDSIDALTSKALAAFDVRTEYDIILRGSQSVMTEDSVQNLGALLGESLGKIENSPNADEVKAAAIIGLRKEEAKGTIEKRYENIAAEAAERGFADKGLAGAEKIKSDAVNAIGLAADTEAIKNAMDSCLTALETEKAKVWDFEDYKDGAIAELEGTKQSGDSVDVTDIINAAINAIKDTAYDTEKDPSDQKTAIDGTQDKAEADTLLQRRKDTAKADYDESYVSITGSEDLTGDLVNAAHKAIQAAETPEEINQALADNVITAAESVSLAGDSIEAVKIVSDVVDAVKKALAETAAGAVTDLSGIVDGLHTDLNAQRAKDEILADAEAAFGELTDEARELIEKAQNAIDNGQSADYALIGDKLAANLDVLKQFDELAKEASEKGYSGTELISEAMKKVFGDIDAADNADQIAVRKEEGLFLLEQVDAVLELRNYIESGESSHVSAAVKNGTDKIKNVLPSEGGKAEIERIKQETMIAVEAERFIDGNNVLRKDFDNINGADKAGLEYAQNSLSGVAPEIKDRLDAIAREEGYTVYEKLIEDALAKSEFETAKDATVDTVKEHLREHDGDRVRVTLTTEVNRIENYNVYEKHTDDDTRQEYLAGNINALQVSAELSENEIKHSQRQQIAENLVAAEVKDRIDGKYGYNDAQKAAINAIIESARAKIDGVPSDASDAKARLDDIVIEATASIAEVPVISVATGAEPADGSEDEPAAVGKVWGVVTNDEAMPGGIKLVIEKTDKDAISQIRNSAKNGKVVAADGSALTAEEVKAVTDGKEVKGSLDIYLLKGNVKITEFEGRYIVKVLLTDELRGIAGAQVVYVADDGSVEVYRTEIANDKYLVFTTSHFSEFYILGDDVIDLTWLIVLLSVALAAEAAVILLIVFKKKKSRDDAAKAADGENAFAFAPFMLGTIFVPSSAIIICIILGSLVVAAGAAIAALAALKAKKAKKARITRADAEDAPPADASDGAED